MRIRFDVLRLGVVLVLVLVLVAGIAGGGGSRDSHKDGCVDTRSEPQTSPEAVSDIPGAADAGITVLQYNLRGGYQRAQTCDLDSSPLRVVDHLAGRIVAGGATIVALQEICRYQYDRLVRELSRLGHPMDGHFAKADDDQPVPALTSAVRSHADDPGCREHVESDVYAPWRSEVLGELTDPDGPLAYGNAILAAGQTERRYTVNVVGGGGADVSAVPCLTTTFFVAACSIHFSRAPEVNGTQIAQLTAMIDSDVPTILAGDFNQEPLADQLDQLYAAEVSPTGHGDYFEAAMCDVDACLEPRRHNAETSTVIWSDRKVDYIFFDARYFSNNVDYWVDSVKGECHRRSCSDHQMVWARLRSAGAG